MIHFNSDTAENCYSKPLPCIIQKISTFFLKSRESGVISKSLALIKILRFNVGFRGSLKVILGVQS